MGDIFRADALRKLRDPQQLDSAVRLTSPAGWIGLGSVALIVLAALVWGFVGVLPYRVDGLGVILRGNSAIFELQAPAAGQVKRLKVKLGERVKEGQSLAIIDLPDLTAQRSAAKQKLDDLKRELDKRRGFAERDIAERQKNTDAQIKANRDKLTDLSQRIGYLRKLLKEEQDELKLGYVTRDTVEQTRNSLYQAQQDQRTTENSIASLNVQQVEFASQRRQELNDLENQVIDARSQLDELNAQDDTETEIVSPTDGVVASISARPGVRVDAGSQVLTVEAVGRGLTLYAYLPVSKGKQVEPGMHVEVAPTSIERDIYGSIVGRVSSVSALPVDRGDLMARIGESDLVDAMLAGGAPIEITVELLTDPSTVSGLKWSSSVGPPVPVTPGTTASASVTVRDARPVDLIVPIYETWLGARR